MNAQERVVRLVNDELSAQQISKRQLAIRMGVSAQCLGRMLSSTSMNITSLDKLGEALGKSFVIALEAQNEKDL